MMSAAVLKVGACLSALFLFGGVCGYSVAVRRMSNSAVRAQLEERWIDSRQREDAARLHVTAEQETQLRPTYQQLLAEIRRVRETAAAGVIEAATQQLRTMSAILTPEQREELRRLEAERRARREKRSS